MKTLYEYLLEDLDIKSFEKLFRFLDKGIVVTNFEFKTPGRGLYILCCGETFLKAEFVDIFIADPITFTTQYPLTNGFQGVVENYVGGLDLMDSMNFNSVGKGILEISDLDSSLDYLLTKFSTFTDNSYSSFQDFLGKGIVYFYDTQSNILVFASMETFLKYSSAVNAVITGNNLLLNAYLPNGLLNNKLP